MALLNTNKTALFIAPGAVVPTPPTGFIETTEPTLIVPEFSSVDVKRITGKLNTSTTVTDTCRTTTSFEAPMMMRASNVAQDALGTPPEYGLLLKCGGFNEVIDTSTPGEETVTYTNNIDSVGQTSAVAYQDGKKFTFTQSLAGIAAFDLVVGEPAKVTGSFQGYMDDAIPVDEANPDVNLTEEPALVVSCADIMTYDNACLPLKSVQINMNPEFKDIYTLGGSCGIKSNFVSDYALEIVATFYVDSTTYSREAEAISQGLAKNIEIKLGLDENSNLVSGKSVLFTAPLSKATVYSDTVDNDLLQRTVTYRLMDSDILSALTIKTGYFA